MAPARRSATPSASPQPRTALIPSVRSLYASISGGSGARERHGNFACATCPCLPAVSIAVCACAEVSAIGASLCNASACSGPLALPSIKDCYGHTEGTAGKTLQHVSLPQGICMRLKDGFSAGAGASGIQMAMMSAHANAPSQLLRSLNPYVMAALSEWQRPALLPRQLSGAWRRGRSGLTGARMSRATEAHHTRRCSCQHCVAHARTASGTSSFGMSGINAHALLATPSDAHLVDGPHSVWQRTRCSPAPSAHPLLERLAGSAHNCSMTSFGVNVAAAGLAFLADHRRARQATHVAMHAVSQAN